LTFLNSFKFNYLKNIIINFKNEVTFYLKLLIIYLLWGLGIGDWGLGIGDWGLGPIPNPQNIFILKFICLYKLLILK